MSEPTQDQRPLVMTLELAGDAHEHFEAGRTELFPRGRTAVGRTSRSIHALPARLRPEAEAELGRPTTIEAHLLHGALQNRWRPHLTRQDTQPLRLHVTVQNKVELTWPEPRSSGCARPFDRRPRAVGVRLWRYYSGPWTLLRRWGFGSAS